MYLFIFHCKVDEMSKYNNSFILDKSQELLLENRHVGDI